MEIFKIMKITVKQLRKLISETVEELELEEQEELETSLHEDEAVAEDEEGWLVPEGYNVSKLKSKKRR
jgi:cell division protein YceG involved in septum cleavage